jgi:hypothetical protein
MQILNPTPGAVYNGIIHGGYRIAAGEGVLGLWRGMSSVIVGAGQFNLQLTKPDKAKLHTRSGACDILCHLRICQAFDGREPSWVAPSACCW